MYPKLNYPLFNLLVSGILLSLLGSLANPLCAQTTSQSTEKLDRTLNTVLTPLSVTTKAVVRTNAYFKDLDIQLRPLSFLDLNIPQPLEVTKWSIDFEPKFGDFISRDFIRYPLRVSYAPSKSRIHTFGITPVSPNPFKQNSLWSLGTVSHETRLEFELLKGPLPRLSTGFSLTAPLGHPPHALNDGYTHLQPYVTLSRDLRHITHTKLLLNLQHDQPLKWIHSVNPRDYEQLTSFGPAMLYKPGNIGYLLQTDSLYIHTKSNSFWGSRVRTGMQWDIPTERTQAWGLPGKWTLESAVEHITRPDRAAELSFNTRVRWKFKLN